MKSVGTGSVDHRTRGALGLARDREFALLDRRHEVLLAPDVERVDLVEEQHALVHLVDGARFDAVVTRRLHPTGLERVVPDVPEERTRVRTGRVLERRGLLVGVVHDEVRNHRVGRATRVPEREEDDPCREDAEQEASADERVPEHDSDDDVHQELPHLVAFPGVFLVRLDYLIALPGGNRPDFRRVPVVGVVVDEDVLKVLRREKLTHRLRKHRLPRPRGADHHHVPALLRGLLDDVAGLVLPDHLVDEAVGDLDIVSALDLEPTEEVVVLDCFVDLGFDFDVAPEPVYLLLGGVVGASVGLVGDGARPVVRLGRVVVAGLGPAWNVDVRVFVPGDVDVRLTAPVVGLVDRFRASVGGVAVFTHRSDSLPERKGFVLIYFPPT